MGKFVRAILLIAMIVVVGWAVLAHFARRQVAEQPPPASLTPEQRAAEEKRRVEEAVAKKEEDMRRLGLRWSYEDSADEMGRGRTKTASIRSMNEVEFGSPYHRPQRAWLALRIHPKYGRDVILSIERGQFLCRLEGCTVTVRFDKGKAQDYSAGEPADHRTTALFIRNYDRFVASAKKAKTVYIEAQFYQEGTRVFEFEVAGLKW